MMTEANTPTALYPPELHFIKATFLHKHYRQCIQACHTFLEADGRRLHQTPIQDTFATFYLGLAHDELARIMHDQSSAKISKLDRARQFYQTALDLLYSPTIAERPLTIVEDGRDDPVFHGRSDPRARRPIQSPLADVTDAYYPQMRDATNIPPRSAEPALLRTNASDVDALDSCEMLHEIAAPTKTLSRDISRLSLLEESTGTSLREEVPAPPRPRPIPSTASQISLLDDLQAPIRPRMMQTSISQGLLRPIRPGSPPKQYHVAPRLPYFGSMAHKSRLSKLIQSNSGRTPTKLRIPNSVPEDPAPKSPVSPIDFTELASETSTVSPMSPVTPTHRSPCQSQSPMRWKRTANDCRVRDHLEALRVQLESHLRMVETARRLTMQAQADRAASRLVAEGKELRGAPNGADGAREWAAHSAEETGDESKQIPQSRSYWSFTPEHVKVSTLEKRILAGRESNWARTTFEPGPYQELAEKALDEL